MKAILISFLFEWQSTHNSGMVFTTTIQVSSTVCGGWERDEYPVGHPVLRSQIQSNPTLLNAHLHQALWSSAPVLAFNHPIIFALREKDLKQKVLVYLQIYQSFLYHLPCKHSNSWYTNWLPNFKKEKTATSACNNKEQESQHFQKPLRIPLAQAFNSTAKHQPNKHLYILCHLREKVYCNGWDLRKSKYHHLMKKKFTSLYSY